MFEYPARSNSNVRRFGQPRAFSDEKWAARLLPLQWFSNIEPSLDTLDFVQGRFIAQSGAVVYGASNSGKTFWVTDVALHVAAGLPWNGRRVDQGGVIYCALEGGAGFRNRIHAWKLDHDALEHPVHFAAMQSSVNLLAPDADTDALVATIKAAEQAIEMPVKLVVIDTLARAMAGGNENASEDMGALVLNMDRIRAETGACVLFVHHSGKDQAKGARGHSSLRAAIDTEIEIATANDGTSRTATVVKQRELKSGDMDNFTLEVLELGRNRYGEPVTSCVVRYSNAETQPGMPAGSRRLSQAQHRALEVLTDLVATSGQSGYPAVPTGILSVPEKWWRDRFYDRAMPGAEADAKQKAFRRASDALITSHVVGMAAGRVWVVIAQKEWNHAGH